MKPQLRDQVSQFLANRRRAGALARWETKYLRQKRRLARLYRP